MLIYLGVMQARKQLCLCFAVSILLECSSVSDMLVAGTSISRFVFVLSSIEVYNNKDCKIIAPASPKCCEPETMAGTDGLVWTTVRCFRLRKPSMQC